MGISSQDRTTSSDRPEVVITDEDNGYYARVTSNNELVVTDDDLPDSGTEATRRFWSETIADMTDNGSVTPVNYDVENNDANSDLYVTRGVIVIADEGSVELYRFGGRSALANGFDLKVIQNSVTSFVIDSAISNIEVFYKAGASGGRHGEKDEFMLIEKYTSSTDAYIFEVDFTKLSPPGIRLGRGTGDKIQATVNDNLTGLNQFSINYYGYRIY